MKEVYLTDNSLNFMVTHVAFSQSWKQDSLFLWYGGKKTDTFKFLLLLLLLQLTYVPFHFPAWLATCLPRHCAVCADSIAEAESSSCFEEEKNAISPWEEKQVRLAPTTQRSEFDSNSPLNLWIAYIGQIKTL